MSSIRISRGIRCQRALLALALPLVVAALIPARPTSAQEAKPTPKHKVELEGHLVCVGCHLEQHGAESQCTLHAKHAQGFLASDGTLYTLLDNARGHALITDKKLASIPIKLEAHAFPKAQVLEVIRFAKKDGERWVQHDFCAHCGFEPGDNEGKGLCEDCAQ